MTQTLTDDRVFVGAHIERKQADWLDRMARMNGGMSRAAALRRLLDNAMRRDAKRDDCGEVSK